MSKKFSNFAFEMKKVYQTPVIEINIVQTTIMQDFPMAFSGGHGEIVGGGGKPLPPIRDARPVF